MPQAVAEEGLQSVAEFWGAAPDHGAAPGALSPESQVEGAQADGLVDGDGDVGLMRGQQQQVIAQGSSAQILIAIMIVLFFMLSVLKMGPFEADADDWLSFCTSLQCE